METFNHDNEACGAVVMLSRARQRRRSTSGERIKAPLKRSSSSSKRVDAQSSSRTRLSTSLAPTTKMLSSSRKRVGGEHSSSSTKLIIRSLPTPPRNGASKGSEPSPSLGTPQREDVTNEATVHTTTFLLSFTKNRPTHRRSISLPASPTSKDCKALTRSQVNLGILKPSRVMSFPIAVLCKAAISVQRLARQYLSKVTVIKRKRSVVLVQSLTRRWVSVRHFKSAQVIACRCQGAYQGARVRNELHFEHYCATRIQAALRGFFCVLTFMGSARKIILIQSIWRMKRHLKMHIASKRQMETQMEIQVTLTQSMVRRWIAMKSYMNQRRHNNAAVVIQANFRRYNAMLGFIFTLTDIIMCQTIIRKFFALQHAAKLRSAKDSKAAIMIQTNFRRHRAMVDCLYQVSDVIFCQAAVRRFLASKHAAKLGHTRDTYAALMIETNFRRHKAMVDFSCQVMDVILCQATVRRFLALKHAATLSCMRDTKAALMIQTNFRRHNTMMGFIFTLADIILCQTTVRRFLALKHAAKLSYMREENAALIIQTNFRKRTAMAGRVNQVLDVIICQTAARRCLALKHAATLKTARDDKAALVIQTNFRMHTAKVDFLYQVSDILMCQATVRRFLALKHITRDTKAALTIQTNFRRHKAMVDFRYQVSDIIFCQASVRRFLVLNYAATMRYEKDNKAILMIQTNFRMHRAMVSFSHLISDVLLCQAAVRQFLASRRDAKAAQLIQTSFRRYRAMVVLALKRDVALECILRDTKAALLIQTNFRRHSVMVVFSYQVMDAILSRKQAKCATKIQASWRRCLASNRIVLENESATAIQMFFLGYRDFLSFVVIKLSVVQIQACIRGHFAKSRLRRLGQEEMDQDKMILQHAGAIAIQSCYRGYRDFSGYLVKNFLVIEIQAHVRSHLAKCRFNSMKEEKRKKMNNEILILQNAAATAIQSCFRGYQDFTQFLVKIFSIIQIQTRVRVYQARCRLIRLIEEKQAEENIIIQNAAATAIQSNFRRYQEFVQFVITRYFVIKIQACVRSHQAQCRLKKLKQEDRERKIKKNVRLSNMTAHLSRGSLGSIKPNHLRVAEDMPLSSLIFLSNQKHHIPTKREQKEQREKKAALVIERFFINLREEIELEIARMEQEKRKEDDMF